MSPKNATIFVDDQNPNINYLCKVLKQNVSGSYYKNTWTSFEGNDCGKGWFQYTFNGTGVSISASFTKPSNFSVKLDDGQFVAHTGNGSYISPVLKDGQHTITYAMGNPKVQPAFDYLTVTAGPSSSLQDKTVIVDDGDSAISYYGSWSGISPVPAFFDYASTMYRNSSHWVSQAGDSMSFQFEGSSISLYGMVAYNTTSLNNITAQYTLDGVTKPWTIANDSTSYLPMLELFRADVNPGNHTLLFNITSIQGPRSLAIDFVAYNASYPSLQSAVQTQKSTSSVAPKVGIALGVVAGFALLLTVGLVLWRKMRIPARHRGKKYVEQS